MIELYNADCLEKMKDIKDKSIDLIVSDIPYRIIGGGCSNNTSPKGILNRDNSLVKQGKLFNHNDIKFSDFLPDLYRVLADNSHCYLMVNGRNLKELQVEAEKVGFVFQNLLVWDKGNATPNGWYMNSCEFILFLRKGKAKRINNLGSKTILKVDNVRGKLHPTQKPVELMKILIENSSNEGDVVLDPFMGSGSTGVACLNTNRNFIGIELDKNYFEIAKERLNDVEEW
jgi:site-specific DNA-methyltransferase (adenine-specific)